MAGTSLNERASLSPEERKRRYTQAYRDSVKPFIEKNFKDVKYDADGNFVSGTYIGSNDSATAGLTKQNFARATEGYASNNDGTYRYRATRELGIPDQIDQNPKYAAKDRMQYYLIDRQNSFDVPARQLKTANDYWGQIYTVMSQDPERGNQLAEQAKYLSTQYGNPLYNPYQTATVSPELKQLFGEESFSAEWVSNNYGLLANLERTAAGNAKAPTKDSTDEQKLAYYYSQILDAENNTLKAEQEVASLKQQISDKVAAAKLNGIEMTADEIYKSLDMKGYTALKAMEDKKLTSKPYELTRAVNYSEDTVYGMIQAAIKAEDSDITGMTDFTASGAEYANEKYVSAEEAKDKLLMQRFYEEERERYRLEQDAELTGDKSIQEKYDAMQAPKASFVPVTSQDTGTEKAKTEEKPDEATVKNIVAKSNRRKAERLQEDNGQMPGVNKNTFEQPEEPKIDVADLESKLATVNAKLEAVDSDENAMPLEQYEQLESEKEQLESQLRAYKNAHPEEYVADKYAQYRNDPKFSDKVTQGSQMENESDGHEQYSDTYADPRADHSALTQDEKDMYNYLLATQGTDAANQYIADLQTAVNARQGAKVAEAGKDDALGQVLYNASAGVVSSLQGLASNFTNNVRPTGAAEFARAELSKTNSDFQNLVNDLSFSLGNMAPSILLSTVTGGIGGAALMGFSAAGNAYNEAMKSGALSTSEARMYGAMVGASEAFLGYMLGGISKLGNSTALKSLTQSISKIDNVFLRASAKIGTQMASEATEEWLQATIEPLLQNWILGMENDINIFSEEAMYSALMGALTAGMLESAGSGMSAATEIRNERSIGKALTESGHTTQLVEIAKNSKNADVRETAQALEAGTMRWSEGNLGRLAIEYRDSGGDTGFLNQPVEANIQPAVTGVTTDRDAAMALNRAIRGQATESDLELLEKGAYIPAHEDVSAEISKAAKSLRDASKAMDAKENQLMQLKQEMDKASGKVTEAKEGLAKHLRGVVRIQNNDLLGKAMVDKRHAEREVNRTLKQMYQVSQAGLKPQAQQKDLDVLEQQLKAAETRVDELMAGNREATVFHGQIANAQKGLDAANDNYAMAELQMDGVWYEYKAAERNFQEVISNSVNRAFGDNVLALLESDIAKADARAQQQAQTKQDLIKALETIRNNKASANERAAAEDMLNELLNTPEAQAFLERQDTQRPYYNETLEKEWNAARDKHEISDEQMAQIMHEKLNEMPEAQDFLNQQQVEGEQYEKQLTEEWLAAKDKRTAEREAEAMKPETAQEAQTDEVAEQAEETAPAEPVVTAMDFVAKRLPADIARQVIDNHTFYTEHQGGTPEAVAMEWEENSQFAPEILNDSVPEEERAQLLAQFADAVSRANDPNYKPVAGISGVQYAAVNHSLKPANAQQTSKLPKGKQPVTAQTIIRKAASALGVPIRTGIEASMSGVPEKAKAYYKQQAVAARVPGDIANIAHEIGHALDARHHFTHDNPAMAQKLTKNLPAQYASVYDAQALPGEAVADMVYTYVVQGEQAAVNFGGDAYYAFWNSLSRGEKRALRTMQAEVDQYRNQTADETGIRAVTQTKADTDLRNASTKVKDMVKSASYNLMDNLDPAMRLDRLAAESQKNGFLTMDKHSETAFATARRAETIASAQLTQAMSDPSGNIIGDSFADCLKGVKADQMVDLSKYLAYVRALDWMDKGRKALDPAITKDEMITFCLKQQDTGVADAAQKIWAWYRKFGQAWLVDSGRMSQSEFNALWKEEPHYVPFNRVIDHKDTNPSSFAQGIQQLNTGIHSVEGNGSQRDIFDPLTSLMQGVANITEATLRNEVGKTILWQVRNSENLEGMVTEVPASTLREDIKATAMMLDNGADIMGQIMDKPLKKPDGTNIFGIVDEGGQISYIQVNDPQLLALMQNPNPKSINKFLGAVAKVTRAVNATVTTLSGTFATRNLPSDANAAWRATPEKNPIRFFVDMIGSAADVINGKNHSADYYEWAAMGGLGDDVYAHAGLTGESARKVSTQYLGTRPSSVKEWGQRVGDAVNSMATALSAISENTTRLTLYKEGKRAALRDKQSGASARAAGAALSRMGTTDFNRSGAQTVGISTLFRFAGATINGNIQSARTLFDRSTDITSNAGKIKGAKVAIGVMARAAALAALSAALMDEDEKEQFRRMDPSAKYSGLVIPWSKFSGVKGDIKIIPYAKDAVSDLMNIGAAIADGAVHGGLWDDIRGIGENIAESLMPFGSPIWAPIDQASKNETWYGGKIIPGHLEDKAYGQLQYDEDTTAMSRLASTTLYNLTRGEKDVSPMLIDYVLEQYFGGVYDTAVGFEEFITSIVNSENGWEGAGKGLLNGLNALGSAIRDGFTRNSITTSDVSGAYYNDVQFVDGIISTIKDGQVPPDLAQGLSQDKINEAYAAANVLSKNLDALGEQISGLYDEMDEVRANQAMSIPDQEREVSEIRKEIYNLQLSGTALVDNYRMEYCGDPKSMMTTPRADAAAAKGYTAFNDETLPQSFRDRQDDKALTRLRDFYQQNTAMTSFKPTYPPDFVDADNVLTAWDKVDSQTKSAMEKAWTDKYLTELNSNGFMTEKDYDTVKNLASEAKRKANAAAKEVYTIKYKFKD